MKKLNNHLRNALMTFGPTNATLLLAMFIISSVPSTDAVAQVAIFQYRHVPSENIGEFVRRENTYWSAVAQKAVDDGKLLYWAIWQKVGGWNLDSGSNFLFVNVFSDKEGFNQAGEIWNPTEVFPEMNPEDIDTGGLSTTKHMLFVENVASAGDMEPKFLRINYAKVHDGEKFMEIEMTWKDFITERIANKETDTTSWRLLSVLAPTGASIPFDAMTLDGFQTLSGAVSPSWDEGTEFPDFTGYEEAQTRDRVSVYALVNSVGGGE